MNTTSQELHTSQPSQNKEVAIQIFSNPQFGHIRTSIKNGEPLFCLYDVAAALGYSKPSKAVIDHCKGVTILETPTKGGIQRVKFGKEAEVYRLIMKSKTPRAEAFQDWVCEDVLPSIRQTGKYAIAEYHIPKSLSEALEFASKQAKTIEEQNVQLMLQAPEVLFAKAIGDSEDYSLVAELSKILHQEGVDIGEKRLYEWLRQNQFLCSKGSYRNQPTQRAMNIGLFRIVKEIITKPNGETKIATTTKLTSKGISYFTKKFLKKKNTLALAPTICE
ncbi:MAG: phage antirepressor KilAC domain-containing protein [Rikenellaceae bacterium]